MLAQMLLEDSSHLDANGASGGRTSLPTQRKGVLTAAWTRARQDTASCAAEADVLPDGTLICPVSIAAQTSDRTHDCVCQPHARDATSPRPCRDASPFISVPTCLRYAGSAVSLRSDGERSSANCSATRRAASGASRYARLTLTGSKHGGSHPPSRPRGP